MDTVVRERASEAEVIDEFTITPSIRPILPDWVLNVDIHPWTGGPHRNLWAIYITHTIYARIGSVTALDPVPTEREAWKMVDHWIALNKLKLPK